VKDKKRKKNIVKEKAFASIIGAPSFFLSFYISFMLLFTFLVEAISTCPTIKTTTTTTKGPKEGVHHNETTMGGIELHHHHHGVLKNFSFSPNLIIQLILEVWVFQIKC
jgi:hypothetical protein